ncbi:hypothetical protein HD806DRAFT_298543 [Xylariaceae sp. AK1471]|nr:hypothetical protein HD806DRAFT_298543 [Xylariaceae sp. AK1471]
MGQSQSHPQEEESCDPNDDTTKSEQFPSNRSPSDDFVFSSQIPSSIDPNLPPLRRSSKIKTYSSSPASRLHSSQAPTPIASHKMADSFPYQSSPAIRSSMDVDVDDRADQHGNLPHFSKKKRRNKKRSSSASHPDSDHRPFVPHSSIELDASTYDGEQQQSDVHGGDVDVIIDGTPMSAEGQSQARNQHKRDRKESKRAAKLAKQQAAAANSTSEATEEQSRFAENFDAQERATDAKREQEEEEDAAARLEEITEPPTATTKKRKRRSQTQVEDSLEQSSKKHKHSHSGASAITTEDHGEQGQNGAIEGAEASLNSGINLNILAEQLYSGRKRNSYRDVLQEELGSPTVDAVVKAGLEYEHEDEEPVELDADGEGGLIRDGLVESEPSDEMEMYRDDNIDYDYHADNGAEGISSVDEELPIDPMLTRCRSSDSIKNLNGSAREIRNDELITTGVTHDEVGSHGEQNGADVTEEVAPSHISGPANEEVEVPSSMPRPSSAGESSTKRRATTKTSTGRKRVAKPDFFSRVANDIDENTDLQSPTTAALSRKKGKGKQIAISEDETSAGPSTINGKARQLKITGMLKDSASADGDNPMTPSSESVVRLRTPKTPATLSGAFSDFEVRNLSQAIERYRDDHQMTQHQVNELIHSNPKEATAGELWDRIMATCPNRSRQKVINQTRRRFHNFVARGTWTPDQEQELKRMYDMYGTKYSLIGTIINRHPEDIRDRIRNYLICGDKQRKDQWSPEETEKLIAIVEQAITEIRQQRVKRGLDDSRPVEEDINWQLVSQGMDRTRSRLQCISKWKAIKPQLSGGGLDGEMTPIEEIIQQARETATTMSYKNRSLILKAVLKTGANADSRIPWLKVRNELGLQWTRPPLMVVWFRLRRTLPNWQSLNVKEICTILLQDFQRTHKLEYPSEENNDVDYNYEYREIEYKIKRGRKSNPAGKTPATVAKTSDDEDEEEEQEAEEEMKATRNQADAPRDDAAEEAEALHSHRYRPSSVDLGTGIPSEKEPEVEDSEPEAKTRNSLRWARSRGSHIKPQDPRAAESDNESSDTNASQVSSIPAR